MTTKRAEWPLLVYLDQKGWIDLAKVEYRSVKTCEEARLLETIYHAVEKDKALFPLSIVHLDEMPSRRKTWRRQLAALMVKLSKGYSLSPYRSTIKLLLKLTNM